MEENNEINWKVIESYFKNDHLGKLVRHQLESYNHFIDEDLINTINMFNPVVIHSENAKDPETGLYKLEILIKRKEVYEHAKKMNPARWSNRNTRDWSREEKVYLNHLQKKKDIDINIAS